MITTFSLSLSHKQQLSMIKYLISIVLCICVYSCKTSKILQFPQTKIAFGSCGNQDIPQPILSIAAEMKPDAFVFLGDNIYGDTDVMDTLRNKYARWAAQSHYQKIKATCPIFATWDDHDFGRNDAGKYYPFKKESKDIFMKHFDIKSNHEMTKHEGIYHTNYIQKDGKTIQLIMLDVRTFRNDVLLYDGKAKLPRDQYFYKPDYMPHTSTDSTLLGAQQWQWLESELKKPADLRLICSGSQFSIEYNGYEAWANFPHEQQRMVDLINKTKADGIIFLTGDVHYAEISRLENKDGYPIYDCTASGITSTWDFATPNQFRIEGPVMENHFGLLSVEWQADPIIKMEIIDISKNQRIEYTLPKSSISYK
jgi:alkaline phosphatase D